MQLLPLGQMTETELSHKVQDDAGIGGCRRERQDWVRTDEPIDRLRTTQGHMNIRD